MQRIIILWCVLSTYRYQINVKRTPAVFVAVDGIIAITALSTCRHLCFPFFRCPCCPCCHYCCHIHCHCRHHSHNIAYLLFLTLPVGGSPILASSPTPSCRLIVDFYISWWRHCSSSSPFAAMASFISLLQSLSSLPP